MASLSENRRRPPGAGNLALFHLGATRRVSQVLTGHGPCRVRNSFGLWFRDEQELDLHPFFSPYLRSLHTSPFVHLIDCISLPCFHFTSTGCQGAEPASNTISPAEIPCSCPAFCKPAFFHHLQPSCDISLIFFHFWHVA